MPAQGSTTAKLSHPPLWICTCQTRCWMMVQPYFPSGSCSYLYFGRKVASDSPSMVHLQITRTVSTNSFPCHSFLPILRRIHPLSANCRSLIPVFPSYFPLPFSPFGSVVDPILLILFFYLRFHLPILLCWLPICDGVVVDNGYTISSSPFSVFSHHGKRR